MDTKETIKKTGHFIRNFATLKIFSIGFLILVLLIPISMISSLMMEREDRKDSVVREISSKWGRSQTITGPFFTIPYKSFYKDKKDQVRFKMHYLYILPENLNISGKLDPQIRYRSIYQAVLYNSQLNITGNFKIPDLKALDLDPENILWEKAAFSIGITDMRGIQDNIVINYNKKAYKAGPGLKTKDIAGAGVQSMIPLTVAEKTQEFSFELNLNGSEEIHFIPMGETTCVSLSSDWPSPSFNGSFLPEKRMVSGKGFTSQWRVLHLNRNFPQTWKGGQYKVNSSGFGVRLLMTADPYQKTTRVAKYAIMFIVFTFAAFFFSEILNKKRVHPIQYILVGLAVILFYVLLLAISEHLNFNLAYIISSSAITLLITLYSKGILKNTYFSLTLLGILVILYAYLFIVLQLEDYALIMGSVGLFGVLTLVMYITRKIDWYNVETDMSE